VVTGQMERTKGARRKLDKETPSALACDRRDGGDLHRASRGGYLRREIGTKGGKVPQRGSSVTREGNEDQCVMRHLIKKINGKGIGGQSWRKKGPGALRGIFESGGASSQRGVRVRSAGRRIGFKPTS